MCFFFTQTLEWLKYEDPCFLAPKPSPPESLPPLSQAPDVVSPLPPHHRGNERRPGDDGVWGTGPLWERYLPRGSCLLNLWISWAKVSDEANLNQFKIRTRARTLSPWAEVRKENNSESTDNPFTSLGPSPITTFLTTTLDTAVNKERNQRIWGFAPLPFLTLVEVLIGSKMHKRCTSERPGTDRIWVIHKLNNECFNNQELTAAFCNGILVALVNLLSPIRKMPSSPFPRSQETEKNSSNSQPSGTSVC